MTMTIANMNLNSTDLLLNHAYENLLGKITIQKSKNKFEKKKTDFC